MNSIEIVIILLLLLLAVPDLCRRWGRPALANAGFVVFGIVLSTVVNTEVRTMLLQAGAVGFLLLLFEVGLEVDLPPWRKLLRPVGFALAWVACQAPVVAASAHFSGLSLRETIVAIAALTSCGVGMAYPAWKAFPAPSAEGRHFLLLTMIALEVQAIVSLAVGGSLLSEGLKWTLLLKVAGTITVLGVICLIARKVEKVFQVILERTTHWRVHLLILLVLLVCAVAERLGVSAPKAAFFLGLFMSRIEHDGQPLETFVAPLTQRFLIPVFFVSLGLQVPAKMLLEPVAFLALATALILFGYRHLLHRHLLRSGASDRAWLLFSPNLTMVALAATTFIEKGSPTSSSSWLLLSGLFVSAGALLLLPPAPAESTKLPQESAT